MCCAAREPVRTTYVSKSNFFMPAAMASRLIMMRWPSCTGLTLCSAPFMLSIIDDGRSFMSFSTNCAMAHNLFSHRLISSLSALLSSVHACCTCVIRALQDSKSQPCYAAMQGHAYIDSCAKCLNVPAMHA